MTVFPVRHQERSSPGFHRREGLATAIIAFLAGALQLSSLASAAEKPLLYGTTGGAIGEIARYVADLAASKGLEIKVVEFNDWVTPNEALNSGDIDLNVFQNQRFLEAAIKARGYKIVSIGSAYLTTNSIHSTKYRRVEDIPEGSSVGIANDPVNTGRGLLLFQQAGLIKLKGGLETEETVAADITPADIVENPKRLKFVSIDNGLLARSLDDLAAASVFDDDFVRVGGDPKKALIRGGSPKYSGQIVVRQDRKDDPRLKRFAEIYRSSEVKAFIETRYNDRLRATW